MMKQILQYIAKYFWPFFIASVWPIIKDDVNSIVKVTFENLRKWYEKILNERSRKREEEAKRKAEEAEVAADKAKDKAEAENYRAIAEIWRQVAEEFRQDNEFLKEKLATATQIASQEAENTIQAMQIKTDKNKIVLTSGDKILALPALSDSLPSLTNKD